MFGHYLELGVRHLRRNPALTGLMIVTLAVGVAASMATLTVLRAMSADPIPAKSDRIVQPLVDLRPVDASDPDPEPPNQLSYRDAVALHAAHKGVRQSISYRISPVVEPRRPDVKPFFVDGMVVHADFFPMLGVRFVRGAPWTADDEARAADVCVITEGLAARVFGAVDPIGRTLRVAGRDKVVTGVIDDAWEPTPRFYRLVAGPGGFAGEDDVLIPFPNAIASQIPQMAQINCYQSNGTPGVMGYKDEPACVWLALWVELRSADEVPAYRDFVAAYVAEQRKLGRFPRPDNHRVHDVRAWLDVNQVVAKDRRLQTYVAFGFLLVCLVNTIGLLLAKFSARTGEIGVRRALGATRRAIFQQYLIEAGVVGVVGGLVGLGLTWLALHQIAKQSEEARRLASLDPTMLAVTLGVAVVASVLAGLLPTWRASRVTPALQLKSQ